MSRNGRIIVGAIFAALIIGTFVLTVLSGNELNEPFLKRFGTFVAAWFTFCILSFLYADNPFYKLAEHVMVGLAMGYFAVYYVFQVLEPRFYDRLVLGKLQPGDTLFGNQDVFRYALIIPALLGFLMLFRLSSKFSWLSRWPMAIVIGIASGLAIPVTVQMEITKQLLAATMVPVEYLSALHGATGHDLPGFTGVFGWQVGIPILMVGTICGLTYFFFSVPHRGPIGHAATVGIWVLMLGFGASFGYTVMARFSLLIGRALFLLKDWLHLIQT